jgi:hypothetical protein
MHQKRSKQLDANEQQPGYFGGTTSLGPIGAVKNNALLLKLL